MRIMLNIFLAGTISLNMMGQELKDSSLFNPGIEMIRQSKTEKDFIHAADYFSEITSPASVRWLALYYTALCDIQATYRTPSDEDKDKLLDIAQTMVDTAFRLKPGEPELLVLQAFLYQSRIQVNPQLRGAMYSMKADASLKKAAAANEDNPRVWSLMGYNIFHTPAIFGGGPDKALPLFLKARDKFMSFKPVLTFYPHWGEKENQQMIEECKKSVK